jgi:hypothetical protein
VVAVLLAAAGGPLLFAPASGADTGAGQVAGPGPPPVFGATGYFRIVHGHGRWWFATPDGHPFYSAGVDHVSASPDLDVTTGQCPYCEAIAKEYPSTSAWATATVARLRSWGINTIGPFSDNSTFSPLMPYTVQLSMASGDDWFSPSFVTHADEVAAAQVAPLANDPNLIGYFTDSELHWGPDGSDPRPVLDNYLALPPGSPGLAVAQQYANDPNGFVYALATRYFQVTTAAVRMYDPHHLILGVKAEAQEIQPELLEAARPYVDVFSIDDYELLPGLAQVIDQIWPQYLPVTPTFDDFEKYVQRPILVGEYSFRAADSGLPNTVPPVYATYATQQERASAYANYVAPLYEDAPWVVGDYWFEYVDEPAGGRFDGENNNFGLVTVNDQPYQALVDEMEVLHSIAPDHLYEPGPSCDSWAAGSGGVASGGAGGVTCTAQMPAASYPVSIITGSLPGATEGTAYSASVTAAGGRPGYRFSVLPGGRLPPGLWFDPVRGRLSGVPSTPGTFGFTVQATDSTRPVPLAATQSYSVTVVPSPVEIGTTSVPTAVEGSSYRAALTAEGGTHPYSWSVSAGSLPPGLTLQGDGRIYGRPTATGTFSFGVEVTDSSEPRQEASAQLVLTVGPPLTTIVLVPKSGSRLSGSTWLDAGAGAGVVKVQFELSGGGYRDAVVATATPTYVGWLAGWDTETVPDGDYTLRSVAYDAAGESGESAGVDVTVAN